MHSLAIVLFKLLNIGDNARLGWALGSFWGRQVLSRVWCVLWLRDRNHTHTEVIPLDQCCGLLCVWKTDGERQSACKRQPRQRTLLNSYDWKSDWRVQVRQRHSMTKALKLLLRGSLCLCPWLLQWANLWLERMTYGGQTFCLFCASLWVCVCALPICVCGVCAFHGFVSREQMLKWSYDDTD